MLRVLFDFVVEHVIKPTWRRHFRLIPLRKKHEGRPHWVGQVALDKRKGFVKYKESLSMPEHRDADQVVTTKTH